MSKRTDPRNCGRCGGPLPPPAATGRPRTYCSNSCRSMEYVDRVKFNGFTINDLGERDGWRCYLCGDPIDRQVTGGWAAPCLDHIIPTILGGQTAKDNLAIVHTRCNMRKGGTIVPHPLWDAA